MNRTSLFSLFITGLLAFVAIGAYLVTTTQRSSNGDDCRLDRQDCTVHLGERQGQVTIQPRPVVTEEELILSASLPENWRIKAGHVEGINMYMGKTPVLVEKSGDTAITFLGSCSEPSMQWRVVLHLQNDLDGRTTTRSFSLVTHQNGVH